ncbi:M1 family aminopeptidase [Tetrabaena socialis]|uniref:M1 family aminopeptidase n=1 Tax=Tetrabaena socialis TaxID=47790 RepID=A0A2J8A3N8_9CHLO|nr:M1 family aminopeptidase [Tetrabaena socialis]|eukprot:PNH07130.1 M1 family aminopeptidase [Tetrabaena socialis]
MATAATEIEEIPESSGNFCTQVGRALRSTTSAAGFGVGWYSQAGTPHLRASSSYDAVARSYTLTFKQHTPPSPGQEAKEPVLIPIKLGLLGPEGADMQLRLQGADGSVTDMGTEAVLRFESSEASFTFLEVAAEPVPSLLRGFSAPVRLEVEGQGDEQLQFLLAHDTDPFNRQYDSGRQAAMRAQLERIVAHKGLSDNVLEIAAKSLK